MKTAGRVVYIAKAAARATLMAVALYAAVFSGMYVLHLMVSYRVAKGSALVPTV